jgi:cellulose synthase/poly-beta-1,6-N-acetylglucosamine synthase-like glycosyltransferase
VLGVIVPAYNEERSLEQVVRRVLQEPLVRQMVIVDDCSTDGTLAAARRCASDATTPRLFGEPDPYHRERLHTLDAALTGDGKVESQSRVAEE